MMTLTPQERARRIGAKFELDVLKWFRSKNITAERLRLAGRQDEGDIAAVVAGTVYVFELKNTTRLDLPRFWREATDEAANYARARGLDTAPPAYVIVKRRNAGIEQSWVIQSLEAWLGEREA